MTDEQIREAMIAAGVLKPANGSGNGPELLPRVGVPEVRAVLRIDYAGRKAAERTIARPLETATGIDYDVSRELRRRRAARCR